MGEKLEEDDEDDDDNAEEEKDDEDISCVEIGIAKCFPYTCSSPLEDDERAAAVVAALIAAILNSCDV